NVEVLRDLDLLRERSSPAQFRHLQRLSLSMVLDEEADICVVEPGENGRKRQPQLFRFEIAPRSIGSGGGDAEKRVRRRSTSRLGIEHGQLGAGQPLQRLALRSVDDTLVEPFRLVRTPQAL